MATKKGHMAVRPQPTQDKEPKSKKITVRLPWATYLHLEAVRNARLHNEQDLSQQALVIEAIDQLSKES